MKEDEWDFLPYLLFTNSRPTEGGWISLAAGITARPTHISTILTISIRFRESNCSLKFNGLTSIQFLAACVNEL